MSAVFAKDFPLLNETVHGKPLIYFDNAASAPKPYVVLERMQQFYETEYANIHRGTYLLSERATMAYESARKRMQRFIHAPSVQEIVFCKGATEAINLIAHGFEDELKPGDEILVSHMEHHANFVPWQQLCKRKEATLKIIPVLDNGTLDLDAFEKLLSNKTKLLALTHVSNAIGTVNPIKTMIEMAHHKKIPVLIDGAQAVPHFKIDVQELDCEFYVFSGHKMYGPTGVGVLYGKLEWLERLSPYQYGGDMILDVSIEKTVFQAPPFKFEAGTPPIAEVIGLATAADYLESVGFETIEKCEHDLRAYAVKLLNTVPGIRIIPAGENPAAVLSFLLHDIHPHDLGTLLDQQGIAIRTGHHCAMPLLKRFNLPATARVSFAFYNRFDEIDALIKALNDINHLFGYTHGRT